jgi:hypothetical protein
MSTSFTPKTNPGNRGVNNNLNLDATANPGSKITKELEIDRRAREALNTSTANKEKETQNLLRERACFIEHVKLKGKPSSPTQLFLNMTMNGLEPTPICQAYKSLRVPTVSTYHFISVNTTVIQLDRSALKYIPESISKTIDDLSNKQVDLLLTVIDGRLCSNAKPLNLVTHPWTHCHARSGDDVKCDVNMGIFPEVGFQKCTETGSVSFGELSPMQVHAHPGGDIMLYSPNNAHFEPIPDSPFGVCWSAAQKDGRVVITKMLVLFDYNHPICEGLLTSIRNGKTLTAYLEELEKVQKPIQETFRHVINLFENADPTIAIANFRQLPPAFQYGIFKQAWILKGSPCGIHGDFGKASFEGDPSLNKEWHCTSEECAQAIRNYVKELNHILCVSQKELTLESQPLIRGDNVLKLMKCAQLLQNKEEEAAMKLFEQFSVDEKEAIYLAIWELCECPLGNMNFGSETFEAATTELLLKAEALLLAASRLQPHFLQQNLQQPEKIEPQEELPPVQQEEEQPHPILIALLDDHTIQANPLELMSAILYNFDLPEAMRLAQFMELFNTLDEGTRHTIQGKVFEHSTDPNRGKDSQGQPDDKWGEHHVAKDLNTLMLALSDIL